MGKHLKKDGKTQNFSGILKKSTSKKLRFMIKSALHFRSPSLLRANRAKLFFDPFVQALRTSSNACKVVNKKKTRKKPR